MEGGAVLRKDEIKKAEWLQSYEDFNVHIGGICFYEKLTNPRCFQSRRKSIQPQMMPLMISIPWDHPNPFADCLFCVIGNGLNINQLSIMSNPCPDLIFD